MMPLIERWQSFVRPEHGYWTWRLLSGLYDTGSRQYHNMMHIYACLSLLDELDDMGGLIEKKVAELALFWHDAVYVPGSNENEEASARLLDAVAPLLHVPREAEQAKFAIYATQHRDGSFGSRTVDAVVDIDLSILGAPKAKYATYVSQVRGEYEHVSNEAWRVGRVGFLAKMIARASIFTLPEMHDRFENQARINMRDELFALEASNS
jgi:predicted metal-dependent HD superfamily phosphohydrolase